MQGVARSRQVCGHWLWKHCSFRRDCLEGKRNLYTPVLASVLLATPPLRPTKDDLNQSGPLLAAQAVLRLCSGAAQPRLRVKQRLLRVEALTGAGEKNPYVRLLGYSSMMPASPLLVLSSPVHRDAGCSD